MALPARLFCLALTACALSFSGVAAAQSPAPTPNRQLAMALPIKSGAFIKEAQADVPEDARLTARYRAMDQSGVFTISVKDDMQMPVSAVFLANMSELQRLYNGQLGEAATAQSRDGSARLAVFDAVSAGRSSGGPSSSLLVARDGQRLILLRGTSSQLSGEAMAAESWRMLAALTGVTLPEAALAATASSGFACTAPHKSVPSVGARATDLTRAERTRLTAAMSVVIQPAVADQQVPGDWCIAGQQTMQLGNRQAQAYALRPTASAAVNTSLVLVPGRDITLSLARLGEPGDARHAVLLQTGGDTLALAVYEGTPGLSEIIAAAERFLDQSGGAMTLPLAHGYRLADGSARVNLLDQPDATAMLR